MPNVAASGDPIIMTSNANDFFVAIEVTTGSGPTAGSGFAEAIPFTFNNLMVQYQIVSAASSYTATLGSGGRRLGRYWVQSNRSGGGDIGYNWHHK